MDKFLIRQATLNDADAVAGIYNHYVRAGGATFDTQPWERSQVIEIMDIRPPECWLVAVDATGNPGDQMLGWASARKFSDRHGYRLSVETAIYLSPEAQGRGVADRLQRELEAACVKGGLHHATARILVQNHRSLQFHYRHGYEKVGVQKEIGNMDEKWIDVMILQKLFDER